MSPLVGSPPTEKSERKRTDTRSVGPFPRGTDGSNPVPSSKESLANSIEKRCRPRAQGIWTGLIGSREAICVELEINAMTIASYPLVILLLSRAFLRMEDLTAPSS
jgi:hypothetical protein